VPRKSNKTDAYLTHPVIIDRIMKLLPDNLPKGTIVEPSAGTGSFVNSLEKKYPAKAKSGKIIAVEIYPEFAEVMKSSTGAKVLTRNFLTWQPKKSPLLVIGNPPFSVCEEFVTHALEITKESNGEVIFLLRAAFMESKGRMEFNRTAPLKRVNILVNRPSFFREEEDGTWSFKGSDQTMYAVFQWDWSYSGPRQIDFIEDDWKKLVKEYDKYRKEG